MRKRHYEELELEQYRQCYESLRHRFNLLWQVPSIEAIIVSGIIVAAYRYLNSSPCAQVVLLFIGFLVSLCFTLAVFRHRYFAVIEQRTLSNMESKLGLNLIQRITDSRKQSKRIHYVRKKFWYTGSPEEFGEGFLFAIPGKFFGWLFRKTSASWWLIMCSFALCIIIFSLFLYEVSTLRQEYFRK